MAPSTHIITDLTTIANTAPTALSVTKSNSGAGDHQDLQGNATLCLTKAQEIKALLNTIELGTDAADPNLTVINNLLGALI
jgi:hypothetical protein